MNWKRPSAAGGERVRLLQCSRQEILEAWPIVIAVDVERSGWTDSMDI